MMGLVFAVLMYLTESMVLFGYFQVRRLSPNNALDSDIYSAPLRAPVGAHHRER